MMSINNKLLVLAIASVVGCDQATDVDERSAELEDLDGPQLTAPQLELEDVLDDNGRPLTTEILVLSSSPEQQRNDELAIDEHSPGLEAFGDAIGIGPDDVPAHADDVVAELDPESAIALDYSGTYSYGGNLWSMSYDIIRGHSNCGSGRTRAFASAYAEGAGSCFVLGWYTFAPTDCRIRVRINQPGWFASGKCKMFVYDQ